MSGVIKYPIEVQIPGSNFEWNGNIGTIPRDRLQLYDPTWKENKYGNGGGIVIRGFERTNEFHLYETKFLGYDEYRLIWYPDIHGNLIWSRDLKFLAYWVHGFQSKSPYNMMDVDVMIRVTK